MNWLKNHLHTVLHAAADLVEEHPDLVVGGLRFVAGAVAKAIPTVAAAVAVGEQLLEREIVNKP